MDGKDGDHRTHRSTNSGQSYSSAGALYNSSTIEDHAVAICVGCQHPDNHCHLCKKKLPDGRVRADISDSVDKFVLFG